jgi:RHS repeat-associated protein
MTSDGRWNYTWNAENRLIKVESRPDTPSSSWRKIEWTYDALGRRIQQVTSIWTNNAWFVVENLKFVSDPMLFGRQIVELNGTNNTLVRSYAWGLDLSGTMEGAGGVGSLLWVTLHAASGAAAGTHFAAYDGNGNVVALVSATTGTETARYEYGPFGEPIRLTGPAANLNPFRFSTKRTDPTTDLVLYEYRVYSPTTGRWLSRDTIGELGGKELYVIGLNHPIYGVDPLGLDWLQDNANFAAGVSDSLAFGLTYQERNGINWMLFGEFDSGVDPESGADIAGEWTERVVEITVTAGRASLRHVAKHSSRRALEGGATRAFRRVNNLEGGFVHHINPIKGHPGGQIARYPLPFRWSARGHWNMKWMPTRAAHEAEHARMLRLEALDRYRESTLLVRQAANELALYIEGKRPCYDCSVDVSASMKGIGWQDGQIPFDSVMLIEALVHGRESGIGYIYGSGME